MTTQVSGRPFIAAISLIWGRAKVPLPTSPQPPYPRRNCPTCSRSRLKPFGGALPVSGNKTRIASAVLALYCVATALSFNANAADPNQMMQFLKSLCIAGGLLQGVAFGAGTSSIDYFRDCDPSRNVSAAGTDVRA
jgi:hypothetical protein